MNIADHLRLGQRKEIAVIEQALGGVLEALATNIRLAHSIGADGSAHRAIDDGDAVLQDLL